MEADSGWRDGKTERVYRHTGEVIGPEYCRRVPGCGFLIKDNRIGSFSHAHLFYMFSGTPRVNLGMKQLLTS
jgi:hypothetical protein